MSPISFWILYFSCLIANVVFFWYYPLPVFVVGVFLGTVLCLFIIYLLFLIGDGEEEVIEEQEKAEEKFVNCGRPECKNCTSCKGCHLKEK